MTAIASTSNHSAVCGAAGVLRLTATSSMASTATSAINTSGQYLRAK